MRVNDNLLASLDECSLGPFSLRLVNVRCGRFVEESNFELLLRSAKGVTSAGPAVRGKFFAGRGRFYRPWLEFGYRARVGFTPGSEVDLAAAGLDELLFARLGDLLPAGSHMMVEYFCEGETGRCLQHGVPGPATPVGYLLWKSGFMWFKNWYFPEGFMEGDMKLQGNKPLNEEVRRQRLVDTQGELEQFLSGDADGEAYLAAAHRRAEDVLALVATELEGTGR